MSTPAKRHHVVIIGSGFGGLTAAQDLKRADVDVTLISKTTSHLFQPLLYQVATGILSEGEIAPTTRLVLRKQKNVQVLLGEVEGIDLEAKTVTSKLMTMETVLPLRQPHRRRGRAAVLLRQRPVRDVRARHEDHRRRTGAPRTHPRRLRGRRSDHRPRRARAQADLRGSRGWAHRRRACRPDRRVGRTHARGGISHYPPSECRVILLEGAGAVLPPMGPKLGAMAQRRLEKMGVEIKLDAMVTGVDYMGVTVKHKEAGEERIECACKVWSAGVQASPLGKVIAEQSEGTEIDRAGRVVVEPDLTVKGYPNVFVVGDLMSVPGVPGQAQGAIQGANTRPKRSRLAVRPRRPTNRQPFKYFDKGSMATVSRFSAVAQVGKLEFGGFIAWLAWLVLHLFYLVGSRTVSPRSSPGSSPSSAAVAARWRSPAR